MIRIINKLLFSFIILFILSCTQTNNLPGIYETKGLIGENHASIPFSGGDPSSTAFILVLGILNAINFSLNEYEVNQHITSIIYALNHSKNGQLVSWKNNKRLSYGKVRVLKSKFNQKAQFCRIFDSYIMLNGAERGSTNTACKNLESKQWEFYK